jgi:magnesium-transporting ATPase (P-type)
LLRDAGLRKVAMLSGDNSRTVNAIAKEAGIDEAQGDLLPDQKIEQVSPLATTLNAPDPSRSAVGECLPPPMGSQEKNLQWRHSCNSNRD